ncbi:MAG: signal recognition particle protein [Rickettsiales bacterium]|jgi:signal recognition particle subunit SRP54|nr:signal recognition particle protein [Rickettsiales bacterium]
MFSSLTNKLSSVFDKLSFKKNISESDVENAIREIRIALLEADVNISVVRILTEKIHKIAIGEKILKGVNPAQQIVKIVNDEIVKILGENTSEISFDNNKLNVFLIAGLQGGGKTTTAVKLAKHLTEKYNAKVLTASADIYRPAAREQLQILCEQNRIASLPIIEKDDSIEIAKRALLECKNNGHDTLVFDTAGRMQIDENLMDEIVHIEKILHPNNCILVLDSMIGQDGLNIAKSFAEKLNLTGCVLTKIDSDSRAGIALSLKAITNIPIQFLGTSERVDGFEVFHPDRIASRILGMGDVVSLVEKAQEKIDAQQAEKMATKMFSGEFNLNDMLMQLQQMKKMGNMSGIMKFLPGMGKIQDAIKNSGMNDDTFKRQEAIILSMTRAERKSPEIILAGRKKRIAAGSGSSVNDVEKLLKQFEKSRAMMKQMQKMGGMSGMMDMMKKMQDSGDLPNF